MDSDKIIESHPKRDKILDKVSVSIERSQEYQYPVNLIPEFYDLKLYEIKEKFTYAPHVHSYYEMIIVEEGEYTCRLNGKELRLGENEVLLVKPGDKHRDYCQPYLRFMGLAFKLNCTWYHTENEPEILSGKCAPGLQKTMLPPEISQKFVKRIREELAMHDTVSSHIQDALMMELFWQLIRRLHQKAFSQWFLHLSQQQSFCLKLTNLFSLNYKNQLKITQMAEYMGMGESSFAHKCSEILGSSPLKEFIKYKMNHAKTMLSNSSVTIKEISSYLGYNNQYQFSRAFKTVFGKPPSEYRK